jgi:hypothetical protein
VSAAVIRVILVGKRGDVLANLVKMIKHGSPAAAIYGHPEALHAKSGKCSNVEKPRVPTHPRLLELEIHPKPLAPASNLGGVVGLALGPCLAVTGGWILALVPSANSLLPQSFSAHKF